MKELARHFGTLALILILAAAAWSYWVGWLAEHPEHDPSAPFTLDQRDGWATGAKLAALRRDPAVCRAVLERSGVRLVELEPLGDGACRRADRTHVGAALPLRPARAEATCAVQAGLLRWLERRIQPAARTELGSPIAGLEHYGTHSCRRIGNDPDSGWSEHATGNAIDIAAFVLADGRRISVLDDWQSGDPARSRFLRTAHDAACRDFGTVLGPDYNRAHRDHFHLDQADRGWGGYCR